MKIRTIAPVALLVLGCSNPPPVKTVVADVQTGLEEAQKICAMTQALLGVNEPKAVATACGIVDTAYPALDALLDDVGKASKAAARIKAGGK